jgi:hypothetical protein
MLLLDARWYCENLEPACARPRRAVTLSDWKSEGHGARAAEVLVVRRAEQDDSIGQLVGTQTPPISVIPVRLSHEDDVVASFRSLCGEATRRNDRLSS